MATERLIIELDARTNELDTKLKKLDTRLDDISKTTDKADSSLKKLDDNLKKLDTRLDDISKSTDKADSSLNKLDDNLKKADNQLDNISKSTDSADSSLKKFSGVAGAAASGVAKLTTAVTALATASTAIVLASANNRRELELLSRQAKTSTEDFQALSFATSQYGINAEQIADISKDVSDKVGEFARDGTGAFQDYANQLRLTKEEAQDAALAFENMSSEQVLGEMVSRMEDAGASGDQMTQVLESMGNDLSKLAPLFANNSKELSTLKARFNDVNSALQITDTQALALQETSQSWSLLTSSLGNSATAISATVAPVFDDFFNDVIAVVPDATQTIIDFVNSFLDAENITSIAGVNKEIEASIERIAEKEALIETARGRTLEVARGHKEEEEARLESLKQQLEVLEQQQSVADANRLSGGEIGGVSGSESAEDVTGDAKSSELQAIEDRLSTETELLNQQYEREKEILDRQVSDIEERNALKLELEEEYLENYIAIIEREEEEAAAVREAALEKQNKNAELSAKTEQKIEKGKQQFATRTAETLLSSSLSTQEKLFSVVKDAAAGQIEAYGLSAGAKALAELGPVAGPPVAASYIGWSQVAAGVVRALPLGGGGGGAGTPDSSSSEVATTQESEFTPETQGLELTQSSAGGSSLSTVNIATESDDDLIELIAVKLEQRMREGN